MQIARGKRSNHPRAYRFEELTQPGRPPGSLDKVPRARATKPADEADRIDNIVVNIRGIEEQYARSKCGGSGRAWSQRAGGTNS